MPIRGIVPACVTPFDKSGAVDLGVLAELLEWQIASGVHGLFVVGTAGEFWALSVAEKEAVYAKAVEVGRGRLPVFAGTADNNTAAAVDLARRAAGCGVDAVTVLTPFAVKLNQDELFAHFRSIAGAVDVGVLLYNNPKLTGVRVAPETAARLAKECPNLRGIKDSSGEVASIRGFVAALPAGLAVMNGYDGGLLAALEVGAAGGVCGSANALPGICVAVYEAFVRGDAEGARRAQEQLSLFRDAWSLGTPPSVVKAGAELAGIPVGAPRPPIQPLGAEGRRRLADVMRRAGAKLAGT